MTKYRYKHIRSAQKDKAPQVNEIELGEIAVNFNPENPFLSFKTQKGEGENKEESIVKIKSTDSLEQAIIDNEEVVAKSVVRLTMSCGLDENLVYHPTTNANYISETKSIAEAIDALDNQMAALSGNGGVDLSGIEGDIQTISGQVQTVSGQVDTISGQVETVSTTVDTISGQVDTVNVQVETLNKNLSSLEQAIIDNEEVVAKSVVRLTMSCGLDENLEYKPNENANYIGETLSLVEAIDVLDNQMAVLSGNGDVDLSGIEGDITILSGNVQTLGTNLEAVSGQVETINGQVETVSTTVDTISGQVEFLNQCYEDVDNNSTTIAAAITKLQEVSGLNSEMNFVPAEDATYIKDCKTITEALNALDKAIANLVNGNN